MTAQRFRNVKCPDKQKQSTNGCIIIGGIPTVVKKSKTAETASSRYDNLKAKVKSCSDS